MSGRESAQPFVVDADADPGNARLAEVLRRQRADVATAQEGPRFAVDDLQTPVVFQIQTCTHDENAGGLIVAGRAADGDHVTVLVPDVEYSFYVQRHRPFAGNEDAAAFVAHLEECLQRAVEDGGYTLPLSGEPDRRERRALWKRSLGTVELKAWQRADGMFRTMYGWTPKDERLGGLIRLVVSNAKHVRHWTQFIESDEYLATVPPTDVVRAFEGAIVEPEMLLRRQQELQMCGWVALTAYEEYHTQFAALYTDRAYTARGGIGALQALPERTDTAPLSIVSFDIECAGRIYEDGTTRFPVPNWSLRHLREFAKKQLDLTKQQLDYDLHALRSAAVSLARKRLMGGIREVTSVMLEAVGPHEQVVTTIKDYDAEKLRITVGEVQGWDFAATWKYLRDVVKAKRYELPPKREYKKPEELRAAITQDYPELARKLPLEIDTDPCFMIVAAEWRFGQSQHLECARVKGLLYKHPHEKEPMDRSLHPYVEPGSAAERALNPKSLKDQYRRMAIEEFDTEAAMIRRFECLLHEWKPDLLTGWNTHNFDLPFLWDRYQFLRAHGTREERDLLKAPLNLGLGRHSKSWARVKFTTTGAGGDRETLRVSTPFLTQIDGMEVWQNTSFGEPGSKSFKLDNVAESLLKYPDSKVPRRKLNFDVARGALFWQGGGQRLWLFMCYCFVDAQLPLELLTKARGKIAMMVALARLGNFRPGAAFGNGVQIKVISLILRTLWRRGGRELLPDCGVRNLHWPDTWLQEKPWEWARTQERFRRIPEGMKGYEGAYVFEQTRGLHEDPILTVDYASLYPFEAISHNLCYSTLLTRATIKYYNVPRHMYQRVPLGTADSIFCGEAEESWAMAKRLGYADTTELKWAYFYASSDNVLRDMLLSVYGERKVYKKQMAEWKMRARVLRVGRDGHAAINSPTALKAVGEYVENGWVMAEMRTAVEAGEEAWKAFHAKCWKATDNAVFGVIFAEKEIATYNSYQLGCKFIINGTYGFTTTAPHKAMMPCMEIGAAITSYGRQDIHSTAYIAERQTISSLKAIVKRATQRRKREADAILAARANAGAADKENRRDDDPMDLDEERWAPLNCAALVAKNAEEGAMATNEHIERIKAELEKQRLMVHAGDSVTGATPVLVRHRERPTDAWHVPAYRQIDALHELVPAHLWTLEGEKNVIHLHRDVLQVWSDSGWTAVTRIIRHRTSKQLCRVTTHTGTVTVTEDHSLLRPDGTMCRPGDVEIGTELLHRTLPELPATSGDHRVSRVQSVGEAFVMGLFLADGSCGAYPNTKSGIKYSWAINKKDRGLLEKARDFFNALPASDRCQCTLKLLDTVASSHVYKLVAVAHPSHLVRKYRPLFYDEATKLKTIPPEVLYAPRAIRQAFYDGYYAGDGSKTERSMRADIKGQLSAASLYWLGTSLDYHVSVQVRHDKPSIHRLNFGRTHLCKPPHKVKKLEWMGPCPAEAYVYDLETRSHHFAAGVGELVVHNTDSVMVGYPREFAGTNMVEVLKLGVQAAEILNDYQVDKLVLEQEKASHITAYLATKHYLMLLFGHDNPKYWGFEPVRRDALPFIQRIIKEAVNRICNLVPACTGDMTARVQNARDYLRTEMDNLARGEVPFAELVMSKQIRRLVYKTEPEVMGAVHKIQARKGHVEVGQRVSYVFTEQPVDAQGVLNRYGNTDVKHPGTLLAEDVEYVLKNDLPLDLKHYYDHKVVPPVTKLLRHMLAPVTEYPAKLDGMTAEELKKVEADKKVVTKYQNKRVASMVFDLADERFSKRRRITYNRELRKKRGFTALFYENECPVCSDVISTPTLAPTVCKTCRDCRGELLEETHLKTAAAQSAIDATYRDCSECIQLTGFGDCEDLVTADECTKYDCGVFKRRDAAQMTIKAMVNRKKAIEATDT